MRVYLIRHAQSEENVLDLDQRISVSAFNALLGRSHAAPLTSQGEQQARALIQRLAEARIERLYSSPFARALTTATILGDALNLTPQVVPDLREVLPRPLAEREHTTSLRRLFVRSYMGMLWPWGHDETWASGYRRARAVWHELTIQPAREIAVVAHRGLNSLILLSLRRNPRWRILSRELSNGGISIVDKVGVVKR